MGRILASGLLFFIGLTVILWALYALDAGVTSNFHTYGGYVDVEENTVEFYIAISLRIFAGLVFIGYSIKVFLGYSIKNK